LHQPVRQRREWRAAPFLPLPFQACTARIEWKERVAIDFVRARTLRELEGFVLTHEVDHRVAIGSHTHHVEPSADLDDVTIEQGQPGIQDQLDRRRNDPTQLETPELVSGRRHGLEIPAPLQPLLPFVAGQLRGVRSLLVDVRCLQRNDPNTLERFVGPVPHERAGRHVTRPDVELRWGRLLLRTVGSLSDQ
jgi:hypothetical protein